VKSIAPFDAAEQELIWFRNLRRSICGFVPSANLDRQGGLLPANNAKRLTLEQRHREWSQSVVDQKKAMLKKFLLDLVGLDPPPGEIEAINDTVDYQMSWPDFHQRELLTGATEKLSLKFADQLGCSCGTGYYIGNNYVVTAGHVLDSIASTLANQRVVFNLTGNKDDHKVFSIRRRVVAS
jgi:hypothetical protein